MEALSDRRFALFTWLTAILIGLIYLGIPCYSFFTDGLQFAIDITYSPDLILHPHHVLYPLVPQIIYLLVAGPASGMGALDFLAIFSQWITIAACVVFILALRAANLKWPTVLAGLFFFAASNGIWYFAVTPNQNSIALMFHVITLYVILQTASREGRTSIGRTSLIAALVLLSILSNQVNAVLIIPGLYVILKNRNGKESGIRGALIFTLTILVVTILIEMLSGYFLGGFRSFDDFITWQHSYVFQQRWWPDSIADAVRRDLIGLFTVHIAEIFTPGNSLPLRIGQVYLVIFSLLVLILASRRYAAGRYRNPMQSIGIITALPVFIFSVFFIPENINFRILYIPGLLLYTLPIIEECFQLGSFRINRAWPVILAAIVLVLVNLTASFLPASNPASNPRLTEMGQLMEYVTPNDMIIYPWTDEGHTLSLYAQYFLGCDALTVNKLIDLENAGGEQVIDELFSGSSGGRIILIDSGLVADVNGAGTIAQRYGSDLTKAQIDEFILKWFISSGDEISTINRTYIVYMPR